ncbi:MAG: hypothetical protein A2X64_03200 [Ignavibacteria bacterium GWF2_33_9]|nr:MAG: hypothetical protein A2X64_03200 [Ignavibacteria bacterium GWF2_33_9]
MKKILVYLAAIILFNVFALQAEEGMWTYDNLPTEALQKNYGFTPSASWLEHLRLSSVMVNAGGSASFVSQDGLVMTNHHVGVGYIQKISDDKNDYVKDGFYAKEQKDEKPCYNAVMSVLVNMENVTERIHKAIPQNATAQKAAEIRKEEIRKIEKEYFDKNKLKTDVVKFYNGGEYWVYQYKQYFDIRLVFAPEQKIAYFGGDNDNFTYPRHDLDICFFRVYENDKPAKIENYLKWNANGPTAEELVFISGHPAGTDRLKTLAQLEYNRDVMIPMRLATIDLQLNILKRFAERGIEQARQAKIKLFYLENSKKSLTGQLKGLKDNELMAIKIQNEEEFLTKMKTNSVWVEKYMDSYEKIKSTLATRKEGQIQNYYKNFSSEIFHKALGIVRYVTEIQKPEAERLPGYADADLKHVKEGLTSGAPIYKEMDEELSFADIKMGLSRVGVFDKFWKTALEGMEPRDFLNNLFANTNLENPQARRALLSGGLDAINNSKDAMIKLALKLDPIMRDIDKENREDFNDIISKAEEKLAEARFEMFGKSKYPDANFTLRLTYGTVTGYPYNGTIAPPFTTMYGLFNESLAFGEKGDYKLPKKYWDNLKNIDLSTPMNFVSTCDIIGGNSGSPCVNKNGELVGIVFDGNIESLPGKFVYDIRNNRAVNVDSKYILEVLGKIYGATRLVKEITGK